MRAWRHQEVLPPRRRQETLQAIIIVLHPIFFYQVERGLTSTHPGEKFSRRHKNGELQLWLLGTIRHVHCIKAWTVHTYMHRRTVRRTRGALQGREVAH